ncbi:MFS general substrate transporter [Massarina eburnea CBS 473.64]|uniref:MFS general substrate transporter n=1 Tax=Massarina eburnea CBS 473.64 TaxID=1395130 RepID=A0A6A6SGC8_9PLEO|nr:MFS general substrate transporter [Massarina eburnea CBS 473.64]
MQEIEKVEVQDHSTPQDNGSPLHALTHTKSQTSAALARVTSRLTTHSIRDPGPPPDGGAMAWLQVFCAWLAVINTWGFVNSFGAFQTYYVEILPQPNSVISWIGSTQACLLFVTGGFSGRALDAGYFRPTVLAGSAIHILGIFSMSASKTYWQLLLTQGICTGIGGGLFFIPTMGIVSTYFAKRRGLATGLVTTGNATGGAVYPLVVKQLLGKVGFAWTVRVLGFINVASLAVVIAFMKPRLPPRKSGPLWDMDAFRDVPYMLHVLAVCFMMPPVYFVFYYVASFARDQLAMPYTESLNLVILLNGIGFPFRILPGYLADTYLGPLNAFAICVCLHTIVIFCWLAISTIPSYYAFISLFGLFAAGFQSLFPVTIAALCKDLSKVGTRLGMAFCTVGGSALIGGPLSGAILKASGGYTVVICWAGASSVVGVGLCISARVWKHGWGFAKC